MVRISISERHLVIVVTHDERPRFLFGRIHAVDGCVIEVELRKRLTRLHELQVTKIILENDNRFLDPDSGMMDVQIGCRNTSDASDNFLQLTAERIQAIELRVV